MEEEKTVKQYEGNWATRPFQVKEGILVSYYSPGAREIFISGDFNGWKHGATRLIKGSDDVWRVILKLPPNRSYDYKLIVDGKWITDPNNPDLNPDTAGGANSIIYIGKKGDLLSGDSSERYKFSLEGRQIKHTSFTSPKYKRTFDLYYVLPPGYNEKPLPVIVCLNNYIKSQEIDDYCRKNGFIGILPAPEIGGDYIRKGKPDIFFELLQLVKDKFLIDEDRIYLTGMSNGGLEGLLVSMYYPDLIAASALVFGPYKLRYYKEKVKDMDKERLRSFLGSLDYPQRMLTNLLNHPLYISHGGGDEAVPADDAIVLKEIVEKLGAPVKFEYYPDQGHTWLMVDKDLPQVFKWFKKYKRNRYPRNIYYTAPFGIFKNKIYWAEFIPFELTRPTKIKVDITGKNKIRIEAENIKKVILKPHQDLINITGKSKVETNREARQIELNEELNEVAVTF